jgi:hypothetical protein
MELLALSLNPLAEHRPGDAARIPSDCKHHFSRLNRQPLFVGSLLVQQKPDELMVHIEMKPQVIESHKVCQDRLLVVPANKNLM